MKTNLLNQAYEVAKQRYAEIGIDTEKVLQQMQDFHLSLHCWQADDVKGFEVQAGALSGGIQSTGDFPGAARRLTIPSWISIVPASRTPRAEAFLSPIPTRVFAISGLSTPNVAATSPMLSVRHRTTLVS